MYQFEKPPDDLSFGVKIPVRNIVVIDGDSLGVTLRPTRERCRVRLAGIDAPELDQPYGAEARDHLLSITGRTGYLFARSIDQHNRIVAEMFCGWQHDSLNLRMLRAGLAYNYPRFGELDRAQLAEDEARRGSRGVWQPGLQLEKPWHYRARINNRAQMHKRERMQPMPRSGEQPKSDAPVYVAIAIAVLIIFVLAWLVFND